MITPKGIVLYGVGSVAKSVATRCVALNWPIVAAVNRPGPKVGVDLASILEVPLPRRVFVTDSLGSWLASGDADVAVVSIGDNIDENFDVYMNCFTHGLNVICTGCEASFPAAVSRSTANRIDTAARQHGVSFLGTGFQDTARVGLLRTLAGMSVRIDSVTHRTLADLKLHGAKAASLAGAYLTKEQHDTAKREGTLTSTAYSVFLQQCVASIGLEISNVARDVIPIFPKDGRSLLTIGSAFTTQVQTREGIEFRGRNELRFLEDGEEEVFSWDIKGDSSVTAVLTGIDSGSGTGAQVVNRIPDVLRAAPGLITINDLTWVVPATIARNRFSRRTQP